MCNQFTEIFLCAIKYTFDTFFIIYAIKYERCLLFLWFFMLAAVLLLHNAPI